jgi:cation-transporting ATPase 13A1
LPGQVLLTEEEQFLKDQVPFNKYLPAKLFKTENMNTDSFRCLPCDMLLLNGSVVVNEAMLTGESVPQVKDSIESIRHSELLDIKARHKSNVLFCGTEIIQVQGNTSYPKNIDGP